MLILALESSAKAASAALCRDGKLLAETFQNCGLTHSATLLPMAEDMLKNSGLTLQDVDAVAVARGPGSFTGIRIGVAAAKGLCWGLEKPAIGVSTLFAIAGTAAALPEGTLLCAVMDARRNQFYNALFVLQDGKPVRLCEDRAIDIEALALELEQDGRCWTLCGDGAELCHRLLEAKKLPHVLAPEPLRWQRASGVALAAAELPAESACDLNPVYLRLSQAERERLAREQNAKE